MKAAFFDLCGRHPDTSNSRFAWPGPFDNCSRSTDPAHPNFVVPDAVAAIQRKSAALLALARGLDAPVLSTTCLKVQRTLGGLSVPVTLAALRDRGEPDRHEHAFLAMDATDEAIADALAHRCIVLERLSCTTGAENTRLRTFDPFSINPHAAGAVRHFGDRIWVIFGTGSESCLAATAEGLRRLARTVTIVEDACVLAARNPGDARDRTTERLTSLGVEWTGFDAVCALLRREDAAA